MWSLGVHGGAGNIPDRLEVPHRSGCARAVDAGAAVLADGGSALEAVCAAVRVLEADGRFNAGVGGALDARGVPTHDAALMRGSDLAYGGVASVCGVQSPIDAARAVLEDGRHVLLAGPAALPFLREAGVRIVSPDTHVTPASQAAWTKRQAREEKPGLVAANAEDAGNTVGAVARDVHGELAAATSTGGLILRVPGRVGDSPIPGAGTYADAELGALSATGHGESMLRTVFALRALERLSAAGDPSAALAEQLAKMRERVGGSGGAIAMLRDGRFVHARVDARMAVAFRRAGEETRTDF